ncbi:succinylglutamate desuccinylase/aspartoacylase family protein [Dankookia sp. GCM10030260]|uniref:succinylglutamate desuccinylase/aspartoacylase domain-containing protein n=1 Tax=Dankookia sp. GCM10030260 TaxID=3273390 RepID=UPI00360B5349
MTEQDQLPPALAAILAGGTLAGPPRLDVRIDRPDLRGWLGGNVMPGVWSFAAGAAGPHVAVVAATHGNEIGGAVVLDRWLRAGLRPVQGRLTLVMANLDALGRFDPDDPTASRFIDEDLNRVWDEETLSGGRRSRELHRARALRPLLDQVDVLLDLHSMLWPSDPLVLAGRSARAARLAQAVGLPPLVVADEGHEAGLRMIDYAPFADPAGSRTAVLLEAGSHWETMTVATMEVAAARLLRLVGTVAADDARLVPAADPLPASRLARVTRTVTVRSPGFAFLRPFRGGHVVPQRNTLIALDGEEEIRTPHDDCLLVMPSLRAMPGQTAVRLARFVEG